MGEYRSGHYGQAIVWLSKSRSIPRGQGWLGYTVTEDELFLAMAYESSGDHKRALAMLAHATAYIEQAFPKFGDPGPRKSASEDPGGGDWILCHH